MASQNWSDVRAPNTQCAFAMSKTQVESILRPPTTAETKDMVIFKKTTYRYEEGTEFILLTFKNDELESKDSNLPPNDEFEELRDVYPANR